MSWPTAAQVTLFMEAAGLTVPAGLVTDDLVAAAIEAFELATGWTPFLAQAGTRTFRLGRYRCALPLDAGLLAMSAVTRDGSPVSDARLLGGDPAVAVEFSDPGPAEIVITGDWGRMATVSEGAAHAVKCLAAAMAWDAIQLGQTQTPIEWRDGDIAEKFARERVPGWRADVEAGIARYQRVSGGL